MRNVLSAASPSCDAIGRKKELIISIFPWFPKRSILFPFLVREKLYGRRINPIMNWARERAKKCAKPLGSISN